MTQFISIKFAHKLISENNAILLDVRTDQEFCKAHLCSAFHIPTPLPPLNNKQLTHLRKNLLKTFKFIDRNHAIIVYCKKGIRARHAQLILRELGFTKVYNLGGVETNPLKHYMKYYSYYKGPIKLCTCLN